MTSRAGGDRRELWSFVGLLLLPTIGIIVYFMHAIPDEREVVEPEGRRPARAVTSADKADRSRKAPSAASQAEGTDPRRARARLRQVLAGNPDDVHALEALSRRLLNDERHGEARSLALRCLRIDPMNKGCQTVTRHTLEPREPPGGTESLELCLKENPASAPCLAGMVVEHIRNGRLAEAAETAARLRAAQPDGTLSALADGRIHAAQGEYEKARASFGRACEKGDEYGCLRSEALREEGM
jgi:predicted Zn-dependent protease